MTGREKFKRYKKILKILLKIIKFIPLKLRKWIYIYIRDIKGTFGITVRYIFLKSLCKKIGDNVLIGPYVVFKGMENIEIGENVSIHEFCYIEGYGGLSIGNNVSIAHSSSILSSNHDYKEKLIPIKYQKLVLKKTLIKDNVWIGCGSRILAGSILNTGSIIAAGTVIRGTVNDNEIYGQGFGKIIKKRNE